MTYAQDTAIVTDLMTNLTRKYGTPTIAYWRGSPAVIFGDDLGGADYHTFTLADGTVYHRVNGARCKMYSTRIASLDALCEIAEAALPRCVALAVVPCRAIIPYGYDNAQDTLAQWMENELWREWMLDRQCAEPALF